MNLVQYLDIVTNIFLIGILSAIGIKLESIEKLLKK